MSASIQGLDGVLRNLNKALIKAHADSMKGLIQVAIKIRRGMDTTAPLIPIDTGNLRASWFVDSKFTTWGPSVTLGFTANYAWDVHENEKVGVHFQRPGAGAKFFEASIKREAPEALETIRGEAYIK